MIRTRKARLLLASVAALAAAACSDSSQSDLSPNVPKLAASLTGKSSPMMQRGTPVSQDITRSFTLTQRGSSFEIPETGLKVSVPNNALPSGMNSLTVTVTAFGGNGFSYEFQPTGTTFRQPLRFEQDLGNIDLVRALFQRPVVQYFKSRGDIDRATGTVQTFEDLLTQLDLSGHTVKANVWHFSGYIVAWGVD